MIRRVSVLVLACVLSLTAGASGPASERSIRELMSLTSSGEFGVEVVRSMMPSMKAANPQMSEQFWVEFTREISADEMVKQLIPIYQRHYTEEDMQELIRFYKSPVGRKFIERSPRVRQESLAAGQAWSQQIAWRAAQKIRQAEASR